ncbi:MAG TPA: class I SAM-dependent methyltransferase [Candidatus Baltobacteraceae bacterium]|nr:class I SAM-dependent methyltransferase [Candidatus Baltobacteraceae bacterium]
MSAYHEVRVPQVERRQVLWRTLCDAYFQRLVSAGDTVLELGCGYGDFINSIRCANKIAVDSWPGAAAHLNRDVRFHNGKVSDLHGVADRSVDFVFASNLFEHVSRDDFLRCLKEIRRVLRETGTLNILQPNYRFCYDEYFDDYTHISIYSDRSLCDVLRVNGWQIVESKPRFLPLTVKSRLPVLPLLIRLYLASPIKPMAKQMLVRARPGDEPPRE